MPNDIVIGSGPAGAAAAAALIARGRNVTMLDVGERLEPPREALRARLAAVEPEAWNMADLAALSPEPGVGEGIQPFGSAFPRRDPVGFFGPDGPPPWLGLRPSFAFGGFSNGWGASILPYRADDIANWPVSIAELSPHYNAVARLIPVAARRDGLADLFPALRIDGDRVLPMTAQASELLRRLERRRDALAAGGVHFGAARQAIDSACRACARCLQGCPYGLIFNAAHLVERLVGEGGLTYRPRRYAICFDEAADGVRLWTRDLDSGRTVEEWAERLFVAAGALPGAHLVLDSLGQLDRPVTLRDSQQFFLPMLHRWWPRPDPVSEARYALAQLFLEIVDPAVDAHTVHAQLYSYNDDYAVDMRERFGRLAGMARPLISLLSRRLIVAQGFLHSDRSRAAKLRLVRAGEGTRLSFTPAENPATPGAVARAARKIGSIGFRAGLVPLASLLRQDPIGSSFHCGGTFPMRANPAGLDSDALGRPAGLKRVHLVDASVFPSIPATTITLSVMANAHRIASTAPD